MSAAGPAFVPNPGFETEIIRDPGLAESLLPIAEEVAAVAVGIAPERLGYYKRDIEAVAGPRDDGIVVGRVNANDFKSHWVEFGTGAPRPTKAHHVLRRAAESILGAVR